VVTTPSVRGTRATAFQGYFFRASHPCAFLPCRLAVSYHLVLFLIAEPCQARFLLDTCSVLTKTPVTVLCISWSQLEFRVLSSTEGIHFQAHCSSGHMMSEERPLPTSHSVPNRGFSTRTPKNIRKPTTRRC
jgi:hypothetical protein